VQISIDVSFLQYKDPNSGEQKAQRDLLHRVAAEVCNLPDEDCRETCFDNLMADGEAARVTFGSLA